MALHPAFVRSYKDIDVVVPRRAGGEIGRLLVELGYESNPMFNAMNGNRRQLYYDVPNDRQLILDSVGTPAGFCFFPTTRPLTHAELLQRVGTL